MTMAEQVVIEPATQADLDELSETLRILGDLQRKESLSAASVGLLYI